jgi:outer membrane protein assembly factor BamB
MKPIKRIQNWWSRKGLLTLLVILAILLWKVPEWLEKPLPQIAHTFASSTQSNEVIWLIQELFVKITNNESGMIYAMPYTGENLMALDVNDGSVIWRTELPLERGGGARGLLANKDAVFVATSIFVDAYKTDTGELKWSTRIGDGHVSVITQLDSNLIRVYYGSNLIELDPETGAITSIMPKNDILWKLGNKTLQVSPSNYLTSIDEQTGSLLWTNDRLFYLDEGQDPLGVGNDNLFVGFLSGVCLLSLQTGEYIWCRPDIDIANVAVDREAQRGYAMRGDLVLLTIDLQTGEVLGETRFLSNEPIDEQFVPVSSIAFSDGVLIISFSDSKQTFGIKVDNP